jgi:SAM-dependent methyltransferase
MLTVLDVGCGNKKVPNAIGLDACLLPGVNVVHDLNRFPYPFSENTVDEIYINHVLEHVPDVIETMEELWRISRPGANLHIRVPHFTGILAWKDPTHKRSFTSESFGYFGENGYSYYTHARFQVMSIRLQYSIQPKSRWIARLLATAIQWLLDRHPTFGERHLAYLVGGIDEIQVTLRTIKSNQRIYGEKAPPADGFSEGEKK